MGVVISPDPALCIFCGLCEPACPYGVMVLDEIKKLAVKCDTCFYRRREGLKTLCILACPEKAISLQTVMPM